MTRSLTSHRYGGTLMVVAGVVAVLCYPVGSLLMAMGVPMLLAGFALWAIALAFAVGGTIDVAAAAIRRRVALAMSVASAALFMCAATLIVVGLVRFITSVQSQ